MLEARERSFFTEVDVGYESYVGGFTLPITPIDYNKVKIYIKDVSEDEPQWNGEYVEMCTCDSNGNLVGVGDFNTRSSLLDLSTGIGTFVVRGSIFEKSFENYAFRIIYGLSENDLILTNKSTIFMYGESNITVNYPK